MSVGFFFLKWYLLFNWSWNSIGNYIKIFLRHIISLLNSVSYLHINLTCLFCRDNDKGIPLNNVIVLFILVFLWNTLWTGWLMMNMTRKFIKWLWIYSTEITFKWAFSRVQFIMFWSKHINIECLKKTNEYIDVQRGISLERSF